MFARMVVYLAWLQASTTTHLSEDAFEAVITALELAHYESLKQLSAQWQPAGKRSTPGCLLCVQCAAAA